MRLIDIYRARYDGKPEVALTAVSERLHELENLKSEQWMEMWASLMSIKGDCYLDLGRYVEAEDCFDQLYTRAKEPIGLINRAFSRWAQGRLIEAKEDYVAATKLPLNEEDRELVLRQLARLCLKMKKK